MLYGAQRLVLAQEIIGLRSGVDQSRRDRQADAPVVGQAWLDEQVELADFVSDAADDSAPAPDPDLLSTIFENKKFGRMQISRKWPGNKLFLCLPELRADVNRTDHRQAKPEQTFSHQGYYCA